MKLSLTSTTTSLLSICIALSMVAASPLKNTSATGASNGDSSSAQSEDQIKALETLTIEAPDGSLKASFIRAGAHLTNFYAKDKNGNFRDIVLGYDDRSLYLSDPAKPYYGAIVGRYANRIGNSTFTLPSSGKSYTLAANDNNGADTLHGGFVGYDGRVWSLVEQSSNHLKFSLNDPDGSQGFPGTVTAYVTYTLENNAKWTTSMRAYSDLETPIMLSSHAYWNLEAYQDSKDLSNHYIQLAADRYVATDSILIPNGELPSVEGTALDLRQPTQVSAAIQKTVGTDLCGPGGTGIDNCLIYEDGGNEDKVQMSLWSTASGIRLDVKTNQIAAQVYTGNGMQSLRNITRKANQGGNQGKIYSDRTCVVLEQQSYIDGINHPEWGVQQFYGPGQEYKWDAEYTFSVMQ